MLELFIILTTLLFSTIHYKTSFFNNILQTNAKLRKEKDEEYDRIWHIQNRKSIITESDLIRMNTKEISES